MKTKGQEERGRDIKLILLCAYAIYSPVLPPLVPNAVSRSVARVRKSGDAAAKNEILTVWSSLLVTSTRNTSKGTTRKLYPEMEILVIF